MDGRRPRVVLVGGFAQTAASWDGVRPLLDPLAEVVTPVVSEHASFAGAALALAEAGGRGGWVGYSMGGRLALRVALERPRLVERLVLVSATPGISDAAERAERVASDERLATDVLRDGVDAFLARWMAQPMFAGVPPDAPGVAERRTIDAERIAYELRVLGTGAMEPLWDRLRELTMPVLLVTGDLDAKFDEINRLAFERIALARHVRLRGGHALPQEQPAVLGSLLAAFLTE